MSSNGSASNTCLGVRVSLKDALGEERPNDLNSVDVEFVAQEDGVDEVE
jgi:hypothetical protein